jgi:ABC-type amino acid transport substrate-binding protein
MAIVCTVIACTLSACTSSPLVRSHKESLYERVIRTGKIRCAFIPYPPYCVKDPNSGRVYGIGIDALQLIGKKLGLTIEIGEEVGYGTMVEGLQTGRYDMVAMPVWPIASRAKVAGFSKPLCFNCMFAYAKKGDRRFANHLERINSSDITIPTIDGEAAAVVADTDFPKAKKLAMPQMTEYPQLLLNVVTGKADVALVEAGFAHGYLKHNPGVVENIDPDRPVRVFPCCWMFKRGELEFKAMLDTVLDEVINSGALDRIIDKYQSDSVILYRVAVPYRTPSAHDGEQSSLAVKHAGVDR